MPQLFNPFAGGPNHKDVKEMREALVKGDLEGVKNGAKKQLNNNMKHIEDNAKDPTKKKIALVAIKVKCPEAFDAMVQEGKRIEKQKRESGEVKDGPNLKKAITGDFYYANLAYDEGVQGLDKYYDAVRGIFGIEKEQEQDRQQDEERQQGGEKERGERLA